MPPFNHLHPAIVHFPIALLMTAPLLFLIGALWPAQRRGIHAMALLLLLLGLAGALLALATGDVAENLAHRTPALRAALDQHEEAAEWTVAIFSILAGTWVLHLGASRFLHRDLSPRLARLLFILWLLVSAMGVGAVLRTGHLGGHMVHDLHTHGGEP
ncbi:DUF2231 domain-containing protein [Geothrix alkalitolerans]|uniref:DUF2231 domain-containing protein n=1 Tax=Geothrix alkalitolerans TaxID=2922724 RepID=UPI001FAF279B|nr:DUF2231 domain-containing protein [Geothrix alkalitolerans]